MNSTSFCENKKITDLECGTVRMGIRDGLPICIGYFSVSFAFGIFATGAGLSVFEALLMSVFNLSSAGQFAAVPIICTGGSFIELALSQLVINSRYALMSLSMSQNMGESVRLRDKFLIAFACADEPYAVSMAKGAPLSRKYMYSLIVLPYIGWSSGTFLGGLAGNIMPDILVSAFGITIYAMFIAIIIPPMKKSGKITVAVLISILFSCLFKYVDVLGKIAFIIKSFILIFVVIKQINIFRRNEVRRNST
jgi:4-azaleucine resistance transporter AzlC